MPKAVIYTSQRYDIIGYNSSPVALAIADTMVLFNSAVNPCVYALVNERRERGQK